MSGAGTSLCSDLKLAGWSTGGRTYFGPTLQPAAMTAAIHNARRVIRNRSGRLGLDILRTPETCWDISQAYAFFAYAWSVSQAKNRTLKGCRGFLAPRPGCGV